jgi:mRNA interferase HigB
MTYNNIMRIINRIEIDNFKRKHPQSRKSLSNWEMVVTSTCYPDFNSLKMTFGKKVDYTPSGYTVFDIGGNKYRLITIIEYNFSMVEIRVVWTHNEYSNPKNDNDLRRGLV